MKNTVLIIFLVLPLFTLGQDKDISINYGLFKTTYYQNDLEVGKEKFKSIIQKDENAFKVFKQGRSLITTGNIIGVPSILLLMVTIKNQNEGNTPYSWQWIGGISGSLIGTILYYTGRSRTLEGVKVFNNNGKLSLNFSGHNGIGLKLNF